MSTGNVIALVIVLVAIAIVAALASRITRRLAVRRRETGAEFRRLARETGPWRARAEFAARRRRVDAMGIKPLSDEERSGYERRWTAAQEQFVDSPPEATTAAAGLVTAVAASRGYDVSDTSRLFADLSVHHGRYLDGHRRAAETTSRASVAATEELRLAILGHRALFLDLLAPSDDGRSGSAGVRLRDVLRQVRPLPLPLARRRGSDGSDSRGSDGSDTGSGSNDGRPSGGGYGDDLQGDDQVAAGQAQDALWIPTACADPAGRPGSAESSARAVVETATSKTQAPTATAATLAAATWATETRAPARRTVETPAAAKARAAATSMTKTPAAETTAAGTRT